MKQRVGILGCGWLGIPLAQHLQTKGYEVRGTRQSQLGLRRLEEAGIAAYPLVVSEEDITGDLTFFDQLDVLIVSLPPGLRKNPTFRLDQAIAQLAIHLQTIAIGHLIFLSSISVYGADQGMITEASPCDPKTPSGQMLVQCEALFWELNTPHITVLRLGGLIGDDRHPVYALSKKEVIPDPKGAINLVHQLDVLAYIEALIKKPKKNGIYNVVNPYHPKRKG
ncbi:MAG: SDR family NAD(P)-dependent oxidoreductase, partial [Flavobacteriaceae bacterium]